MQYTFTPRRLQPKMPDFCDYLRKELSIVKLTEQPIPEAWNERQILYVSPERYPAMNWRQEKSRFVKHGGKIFRFFCKTGLKKSKDDVN